MLTTLTVILLGVVGIAGGLATDNNGYELIEEATFRETTVRVYRDLDGGGGYVVLKHKDVLVAVHEGHLFQIERQFENSGEPDRIEIGSEITGDGRANLVIHEWTGGAHCCFIVRIYDIEGVPVLLDEIRAGHGGMLVDLDEDGALEYRMWDWTYAYWRTDFARSPVPEMVLKYDKHSRKFVVACDLMMKERPNEDEIEELIVSLRTRPEDCLDGPDHTEYLLAVLSLMYSGHEDVAWTVAQRAWTGDAMGYAEFVLDLDDMRSRSPWWAQVRACAAAAK